MSIPLLPGNYEIGNSKSPIAIVTLLDNMHFDLEKVALSGPVMTENIGITKLISNVVRSPNIRYLIVCGKDVNGHYPGDALVSLYNNGYSVNDFGTVSIQGTKAADPRLPIKQEDISKIFDRFKEQITLIDFREERELSRINEVVDHYLNKNPGAMKEPFIIEQKSSNDIKVPMTDHISLYKNIRINHFKLYQR